MNLIDITLYVNTKVAHPTDKNHSAVAVHTIIIDARNIFEMDARFVLLLLYAFTSLAEYRK